jgi:hypothetical protein
LELAVFDADFEAAGFLAVLRTGFLAVAMVFLL